MPDPGLLRYLPVAGSPQVGTHPVRTLFRFCLVPRDQALGPSGVCAQRSRAQGRART